MTDRAAFRHEEVASFSDAGYEVVVEDDGLTRTLNVYDEAGSCLAYVTSNEPEFDAIRRAMAGEDEVSEETPVAPGETSFVVHDQTGTVFLSTTDELLAYRTAYQKQQVSPFDVVVEAFRNGLPIDLP